MIIKVIIHVENIITITTSFLVLISHFIFRNNFHYGDIIIGFTKFFFVIIVLFGGIFGMSIANAIFVDEMTVDNNDKLEKKIDDLQQQIEEMKQLMVDNYRSRIEE